MHRLHLLKGWRAKGFSLAEVAVVIGLVSILTFALVKCGAIGIQSWNEHLAKTQAQSLANVLHVDYELRRADDYLGVNDDIQNIQAFWGYMYSKTWPAEAQTIFFKASVHLTEADIATAITDNRGCIVAQTVFRPCWTVDNGYWVELYSDDNQLLFTARPGYRLGVGQLASVGVDSKVFQNHSFGQNYIHTSTALDEFDNEDELDDEDSDANALLNSNNDNS